MAVRHFSVVWIEPRGATIALSQTAHDATNLEVQMKRFRTVLLSIAIGSAMIGPMAAFGGGTYDGATPSEEQLCDDAGLQGGAYGLCIAYCEATDCDLRPGRRDCKRIRANFAKRTGSTLLPCDLGSGSGGGMPQ